MCVVFFAGHAPASFRFLHVQEFNSPDYVGSCSLSIVLHCNGRGGDST